MRKCWLFLPAILIIVALLVIGCSTTSTTTTSAPPQTTPTTPAVSTTSAAPTTSTTATTTALTPKYGGTLNFAESLWYRDLGWPGDPGWLVTAAPQNLFFDTLLNADTSDTITPNLVSATVAPDLKSITLTLRQGVQFHDGSSWNATVCKWNLDLLVSGKYGDYSYVSSVDIIDPNTVKLNLNGYSNSILTTLASTMVASQQAYLDHGANKAAQDWMTQNAVGTGPYKMTAATPNVSITGGKFDNYWKGKPYLDSIIMTNIADNTTRLQTLQSGQVDIVAGNPAKAESDLLASNKNFKAQAGYLSISCFVPDSKNAASPFSNLKVRQAVDYAIDRDAIVNTLGYGWWKSSSQFAVPGTASYDNTLQPIKPDLAKAKQLMSDAGYPNGFDTAILGSVVTSFPDMLTAIQGMLSKIGINAKINLIDHAAYTQQINTGWTGLAAAGKLIDANMGWALTTNFGQNVVSNASLDKTSDFQALLNAALASKDYDPSLVYKALEYMYSNSMVMSFNATQRADLMANYVMGTDFYTFDRALYWSPNKVWLNK